MKQYQVLYQHFLKNNIIFLKKNNIHKYWRNKEKKIELLQPRTMQSILDECEINKIDFFSLDVEGHEYNVLNSIDFKNYN